MHLAVLRGDDARQLVAVLVEQSAEPEEDVGAARQRGRPPRGESGDSARGGGVHLGRRGQIDGTGLYAGRRIEHGAGTPGTTGRELAVEEVGDGCGHAHDAPPSASPSLIMTCLSSVYASTA